MIANYCTCYNKLENIIIFYIITNTIGELIKKTAVFELVFLWVLNTIYIKRRKRGVAYIFDFIFAKIHISVGIRD